MCWHSGPVVGQSGGRPRRRRLLLQALKASQNTCDHPSVGTEATDGEREERGRCGLEERGRKRENGSLPFSCRCRRLHNRRKEASSPFPPHQSYRHRRTMKAGKGGGELSSATRRKGELSRAGGGGVASSSLLHRLTAQKSTLPSPLFSPSLTIRFGQPVEWGGEEDQAVARCSRGVLRENERDGTT